VIDSSYRFQPQLRLINAAQFKSVFNNPVKSTDRYFTLLAANNSQDHPRLGLAITKKIIKKAVRRNAIKRAVRESFRMQQHNIQTIDVVVLARKDALDASSSALSKSLAKHWLKLASLCAKS
jgi:ribonuclease P protein component